MPEDRRNQFVSADEFFRAVNPQFIRPDNSISPGAFLNTTGTLSMSVDWARYSTEADVIQNWLPRWGRVGIAAITAQLYWDNGQEIEHIPRTRHFSHCEIIGQKTLPIRRILARTARLSFSD